MRRVAFLLLAFSLVAVACSDDDAAVTSAATDAPAGTEAPAETTNTTEATTTTAATETTTTVAPVTTTTLAPVFTPADLPAAVLQDGDPWVVPPAGVLPIELTINDVWPLEGELQFPSERAIYEAAGFDSGAFAAFADETGGLVLTGAHLFADPDGAATAFDVIQESFSDLELIAAITGLPSGALTGFELIDADTFGNRAVGVSLTGDTDRVVGVIWITGNLLQFVRAAMPFDDAARVAATFAVADAMATRLGG